MPHVGLIWAAYRELCDTQWMSADELHEMQLVQVRELLSHCFHHVPYYRRVLGEAGLFDRPIRDMDDFRLIPILTREAYRENLDLITAKALPNGMGSSGKQSFTSGMNGVPIAVRKSNRDEMWWAAFAMRDFEWCGMDPHERIAAARLIAIDDAGLDKAMSGVTSPSWLFDPDLFESGPAFGMDVRQDPRKQLEWLRSVRPAYFISIPNNLDVLASLIVESGRPLRGIRLVQSIGEPLDEDVRTRVSAAFGAPIKDLYSTTEAGYMASECPDGHGMHVHAENVLTEVLDEDDRPCGPGETGRLVFTSLHNFVNPFVRYDVLDDVTLADGPCPCGRGLPLLKRIDGRRHPTFRTTSGASRSSLGLTLGLRKIGGMNQFQAIQRTDAVTIRIVPGPEWSEDRKNRVVTLVQDELGASIRVDVVLSDRLELINGKVRMMAVEGANGESGTDQDLGEHSR